ncbi:hypothetical protein MNBD_GAMMA04-1498 [hydrothermal vent metagenome]|uniref:HicB protein n=1 Tax=hydrothermal vent metagenome TaxID=652676 RepID=A0A3B0WB12_9ZZZZ
MKDLKYKGFIGSVEFDEESTVLWGKVKFIKGLITFQSIDGTYPELVNAFHESIDEYLEDCIEMNLKPLSSATGVFQVRLGSDLHYKANLRANEEEISLNELTKKAVMAYVDDNSIHIHNHGDQHIYHQPNHSEQSTWINQSNKHSVPVKTTNKDYSPWGTIIQ